MSNYNDMLTNRYWYLNTKISLWCLEQILLMMHFFMSRKQNHLENYNPFRNNFIFQVSYAANYNQISLLQMSSSRAAQNITYHCKNSSVIFSSSKSTKHKSIKLATWNNQELTAFGKRMNYNILKNECQVCSNLNNNIHVYFK